MPPLDAVVAVVSVVVVEALVPGEAGVVASSPQPASAAAARRETMSARAGIGEA